MKFRTTRFNPRCNSYGLLAHASTIPSPQGLSCTPCISVTNAKCCCNCFRVTLPRITIENGTPADGTHDWCNLDFVAQTVSMTNTQNYCVEPQPGWSYCQWGGGSDAADSASAQLVAVWDQGTHAVVPGSWRLYVRYHPFPGTVGEHLGAVYSADSLSCDGGTLDYFAADDNYLYCTGWDYHRGWPPTLDVSAIPCSITSSSG